MSSSPETTWAIAKETTPIILVERRKIFKGGRNLIGELVRKMSLGSVKFDKWGQWDEARVLPEGTKFEILEKIRTDIENVFIYVVRTDDYPCEVGEEGQVFITDSRFLSLPTTQEPPNRNIECPPPDYILNRLEEAEREETKYIWGGQAKDGTEMLKKYLKPKKRRKLEKKGKLNDYTKRKLSQRGLDCSGYLSWATNGFTPPYTGYMVRYGEQLEIKDRTAEEIADILEPLDVIVWPGQEASEFN